MKTDEAMFRITIPNDPSLHSFLACLFEEFAKTDLLRDLSFGGMDHGVESIELSVGDEKGIVRRIRGELVDAIMSACGEHIADGSEICRADDEIVVQ